jgi:cobaltochelatase CobS
LHTTTSKDNNMTSNPCTTPIAAFLEAMVTGNGRNTKENRRLNDLRRSNLRRICMDRMTGDGWNEGDIISAVHQNSRVKKGELKFGGTFTSARDLFTNITMTLIALGLQDENDTIMAINEVMNIYEKQFGACQDLSEKTGSNTLYEAGSLVHELLTEVRTYNWRITNVWEHAKLNDLTIDEAFRLIAISDERERLVEKLLEVCKRLGNKEDSASINTLLDYTDPEALSILDEILGEEGATTTTTEKDSSMTNIENFKTGFEDIAQGERTVVDALLAKFNMPKIAEIEGNFTALKEQAKAAANGPSGVNIEVKLIDAYQGSNKSGSYPDGKVGYKKAAEVFDITGKGAAMFDFDVPVWTWDAPHPLVPEADEFYQFMPESLLRILMGLIRGDMAWVFGHTGTGKSTLVEQVCARLNYPLMRVNFDSEITRMDLVGRDTLKHDASSGNTVTQFVEGILPQALQTPCIMLADELDAIRPDVAYVYQRVLEGNGMVLNEDGGKVIKPHPWFRLVATGNSRGNGDTSGMYNAVRPQSMAMLDRFSVWIEVDYMPIPSLKKLLGSKYQKLGKEAIDAICKYAKEHWTAFKAGDLRQPLSPRGIQAVAEQYMFLSGLMDKKGALETAVKMAVADRAEESDAQTVHGLLQRVVGDLS